MEFIIAVARNDTDKVRMMLQSSIDVNKSFTWNSKDTYSPVIPADILNRPDVLTTLQKDEEYQCKPLNIAVIGGHIDMVRLLLSAGADINNKDSRGRTAIVCAIYGLDLDTTSINTSNLHIISQTNSNHLDILKNILLCHPNLYYATLDSPQNEIKGITPLCLASYLGKNDLVQALLEDGRVNVDGTDSKNATALMYAARDGNVSIVKTLLEFHASPDVTDSHGWSAIQYAERFPEIVQLCELALKMKRSDSEMVSHSCNVNYSKLSHLLSTIPNYPSSLSHLQFETIKDIDLLDPSASSLVYIIQSAFLQAIKIHDHLSIKTLLMQPPPLNAQSHGPILVNYHDPKTGLTALHHAMRTKPLPSIQTITLLFQAGADMNSQTYYGRTALHHLARFGPSKDGKSWGIQKTNQKEAQHHQSISSPIMSGVTNVPEHLALCASLLIKCGALVNIADPTGNTPLHFAAEFGGVPEVLEVLILEGGADLTLKNKKNLSPLEVCKSEDIRKKLVDLDTERKHYLHTKSMVSSSINGTIRPIDSASEYNNNHYRSTLTSSSATTPSFLLRHKNEGEVEGKDHTNYPEYSDFEIILRAFFNYQTNCTNSIEQSLAFLTDSILGSWHPDDTLSQQLKKTMSQLRFDLCEAHDMFDNTTQLVEKVITVFRDDLEQTEQIHQADWELSELQHEKIEKLFDVYERIDGRFAQLEQTQDDLISQVERLRKATTRKLQQLKLQCEEQEPSDNELSICVAHVIQSLTTIQKSPVSNNRNDLHRLHQDMTAVIEKLVQQLQNKQGEQWKQALSTIENRWAAFKETLSKPTTTNDSTELPVPQLSRSISQPLSQNKKLLYGTQKSDQQPSLSELELSFDILHSNLHEIERDMEEVNEQLEKITESKKKMYELCLALEKESSTRSKETIQSELNQVLAFTRQLFDKQDVLEKEKSQLFKEYQAIEGNLEATRTSLYRVRPPALLQGLLDRLETEDEQVVSSRVAIEKDWKEDTNLVAEIIMDQSPDMDEHNSLQQEQEAQLNIRCTLSAHCYMVRLDASLYCLKVLSSHVIGKSRQELLRIQSTLVQANSDLEETRTQMTRLYDDAAEVARQLFALKTELETIVGHRKEEIVKVWEVVDEVSKGMDAKVLQSKTSPKHSKPSGRTEQQQKDRVEEMDRHQWIIRELEQLKHVHDNLQEAIEELKQEQGLIGQSLRQLATSFIEPQVNKLVGQEDTSLLSVSDSLSELMEYIKEDEIGLKSAIVLESTTYVDQQQRTTKTTGVGPRVVKQSSSQVNNNRLSRLSAATNRLSISTFGSNHSYMRSPPSSVLLNHKNSAKRLSMHAKSIMSDKKRMSMMSASSLSSLSSYQQERMLARASNLSNALVKARQQKATM